MKIAYVHTVVWPSDSPAVTFAGMTTSGLAEAGAEVHLYVRQGAAGPPDQVYRAVFGREPPPGLHIHALPGTLLGLRTNQLFYRRVMAALRPMLGRQELDVVVSRSCTFLPFLARIRRRYGVQTWFESHDFYADLFRRDDLQGRRWRRYEALERRWLPRISGLICLQDAQRRLYASVFPRMRIVLARTGLDLVEGGNVGLEGRSSLVYIGSLDRHKGVQVLAEAVAASRTRPPLVVAGARNAEEAAWMRSLADSMGIGRLVTVHGWLDKTFAAELLTRARAGAVPLLDTFFNRHLTSPLKIFDYYRYGLPVIAADLPTVRELVTDGETGFLFTPSDAKSLAEAIDRLWGLGPDAYARMAGCVRRRAEGLRWVRRGRQLLWEFGASGTKESA